MAYPNSPQMTEYSFAGVHLLPNHPFPYTQRTYAFDGIEIEEWEVLVKDLCGNTIGDVSEYFDVPENFNDPVTGLPQVDWSLKNVPLDFGFRLVYLEINTGANGYIYSSPFMLTADRGEYVSRWDYRNDDTDTMLSTSLVLYYRQKKSQQEISNYTPVSTGITFTATSRLSPFERWNTGVIEVNIIEEYKKIFLCRFIYSYNNNDTLPVRTGLFEAFETPDLEMDENFAEQEISLTRNYSLTYDPNYVPPPIPPDPPDPPFILLEALNSLNINDVKYTFSYGDFAAAPDEFSFMWSSDGITWTNGYILPAVSPKIISVANHNDFNYYYSIYHNGSNTRSNIFQLPVKSLEITNTISFETVFKPTGNKYFVYFNINGFTPDIPLIFEGSIDEINWVPFGSAAGFNSPKQITAPASGTEFTHFRFRYPSLGLTSNTFNFEF